MTPADYKSERQRRGSQGMAGALRAALSCTVNLSCDIKAGKLIHRHAADNLDLCAETYRTALAAYHAAKSQSEPK